MHKNKLYFGIVLMTGLLLAGCSLLPPNSETTIMEEENQEIQLDMPEQVEDQDQEVTTTDQPAEEPSTTTNKATDLPSLESDLGSLTLEEELFE